MRSSIWPMPIRHSFRANVLVPGSRPGIARRTGSPLPVTPVQQSGHVHPMTDTVRLDAKIKRKQRHLARKRKGFVCHRRIAGQLTRLHGKRDISAPTTRTMSVAPGRIRWGIEDLRTQGMARSTQGTVVTPVRKVKVQSGLHHAIPFLWCRWRIAAQCRWERGMEHRGEM